MGTVHPIKQSHEESRDNQEALSPKTPIPREAGGKTDDSLFAFDMVHAIPGRLRFVFPHLKNRSEIISEVMGYLSAKSGVDRVRANHFCASITVEYDPLQVEKKSLVEHLKSLGKKDLMSPDTTGIPEKQRRETVESVPKNPQVKSSALWTIGGTFFVGLSFLGIIIPGLPTPPFVILAAYCYLRGSKRHYRWLMNHPLFSKLVEETDSGPRISRKAKKMTVYLLWFSIFLSCIFFIHSMPIRMMLFIMGIGVSYFMLRK
ncbi:MAG: DUF454 domain-containing protein [Deltaproteobacteria bacterium]|nr:DUF454 domain-containing protein [Deltaproteobacteria bacterium]